MTSATRSRGRAGQREGGGERRRRRGRRGSGRTRPHPPASANGRLLRLPASASGMKGAAPGKSGQSPSGSQTSLVLIIQLFPQPPDMSHGKRTDMLPEIAAAVGFLSSLLRTRGCVSEQRLKVFSRALQDALTGEHSSGSQSHRGAAPLCLGCLSPLFLGRRPPTRAAPGLRNLALIFEDACGPSVPWFRSLPPRPPVPASLPGY